MCLSNTFQKSGGPIFRQGFLTYLKFLPINTSRNLFLVVDFWGVFVYLFVCLFVLIDIILPKQNWPDECSNVENHATTQTLLVPYYVISKAEEEICRYRQQRGRYILFHVNRTPMCLVSGTGKVIVFLFPLPCILI